MHCFNFWYFLKMILYCFLYFKCLEMLLKKKLIITASYLCNATRLPIN